MRCEVRYSPEFLNDLFEIGDYIESKLKNPAAADHITAGIMDATDGLADYPERGPRLFLPGGLDSGYRYVVFQSYLAIYRALPDGVYVVRAVHERQDYMRMLFPAPNSGGDEDL